MPKNNTGCTTCGSSKVAIFTTKTYSLAKVGSDVFLRINIERCCGCDDGVPECPDLDISKVVWPGDCLPVECLNDAPLCVVETT
jgi:hypothetical protein